LLFKNYCIHIIGLELYDQSAEADRNDSNFFQFL
jgi:hypothetical protein